MLPLVTLLTLATESEEHVVTKPNKPNLLFIFTDQQRRDTLSCYGSCQALTPNLDSLASESFVFQNAYVTQPVCTPSRSSIMTGLYPHTTGCTANNIPLRPETPTIAEMVSEEYLRGYYGKWHLGDEVLPQHGFEHWVSIEDYYRRYYSRPEFLSRFSDYHHFLIRQGFTPDTAAPEPGTADAQTFDRYMAASLPERYTKAAFLGREAARFIREHRAQPWVLYVNFLEPHDPYTGPLNGLCPPDQAVTAPAFRREPGVGAAEINRLLAKFYRDVMLEGHDLSNERGCRELRSKYLGNLALMDRAVGGILRTLDECGLKESTIVVFTSDHGDMMGDHGIFEKCVLYEEAVAVPLLVRVGWLGQTQHMVPGRVSQIDLVPTLLELLDEPQPSGLQGRSLAAVLRGEESLEGNDVFIQWNGHNGRPPRDIPSHVPASAWDGVSGPWRTVISSDGWKLNLSASDRCELYDLNDDPHELQNLYHAPGQRRRVRELTARIRGWQERSGDTACVLPATDQD